MRVSNYFLNSFLVLSLFHTSCSDGLILDSEERLVVYPNPSRGLFKVYCDGPVVKSIEIIEGPLGLTHYSIDVNEQSTFQMSFDISNLPNGIYTMHVKTETGKLARTLIKQ